MSIGLRLLRSLTRMLLVRLHCLHAILHCCPLTPSSQHRPTTYASCCWLILMPAYIRRLLLSVYICQWLVMSSLCRLWLVRLSQLVHVRRCCHCGSPCTRSVTVRWHHSTPSCWPPVRTSSCIMVHPKSSLPSRSWRWATTRRPAPQLYVHWRQSTPCSRWTVAAVQCGIMVVGDAGRALAGTTTITPGVASRHSKLQAVLPLGADATAVLAPADSHTSRGLHKTARSGWAALDTSSSAVSGTPVQHAASQQSQNFETVMWP